MWRLFFLWIFVPGALWALGTWEQEAAQIDALMEQAWKKQGLPAPATASDEVFLRRVWLDLGGRVPSVSEAKAFYQSREVQKRTQLIDKLLASDAYVSSVYNQWADVLRLKSNYVNTANVVPAAYAHWLHDSIQSNKPYDQFVYELLSAKGYAWENGAIGYYLRDFGMPLDNMALTSRVFLATRIECAQCHNHPFDKWKQTDFYHLAAFTFGNRPLEEAYAGARDEIRAREEVIRQDFLKEKSQSSDGGKAAEAHRKERLAAMEYRTIVNIMRGGVGQLFSPIGLERRPATLKLPHDFKEDDGKPFEAMSPKTILGAEVTVASGQDAAEVFARWVTSPDNPRFTKVIVNRLWRSMFGAALIEPLDDIRDESKSAIPGLDQKLEELMKDLHYNQRTFLAILARTKAYQAVAQTHEPEPGVASVFAGPFLRRLNAEQAWDSLVTLANYEPDARDVGRVAQENRRIQVSHMAFDAFQSVSGKQLVDMAYARLASEKTLHEKLAAIRAQLVDAKRAGDKTLELNLRRQEGALIREESEGQVTDFIMPLLTSLARSKGTVVVADPNYKINPNPVVLGPETWRSHYIAGYGELPKSLVEREDLAWSEKVRLQKLGVQVGAADVPAFIDYCLQARQQWRRASELESPAPRGHFLRTLGQSDRDFVENANHAPSIPQALMLLNGEIATKRALLAEWSPLSLAIRQAATTHEKIDAVFLAILSRPATPAEQTKCTELVMKTPDGIQNLAYILLNTRQFFFEQ
jgi:hypothetical protein